ncbi:MAG: malate dehydrogenase [Thermoplasmata archaeon]|nr:malate dehydrogenase [Thermoplasmata archaeon]
MGKIAVIGAGRLGSTIAFAIMKENITDELVIIDIIENLVMGEGLDLGQTCMCRVTGSTDYAAITGADLIVSVAGIARKPDMTREQLLGTNAKIMTSVSEQAVRHAPDALMLVVANPMDAMTYIALQETGWGPDRVFGMGGVVDTNRFRYFLSLEFGVPVEDVEGIVLGQHGEVMIPVASSVRIRGKTADPERVARAVARTKDAGREVIALKGATFYAPAHATSQMVRVIMQDLKEVVPTSVLIEGQRVCLGMPAVLGRKGVEKVLEPDLTATERAVFLEAAAALRGNLEAVGY